MKKIYFLFFVVLILILQACSSNGQDKASNETQNSNNNTENISESENAHIDYPEKPIELIVPYDEGGGTDTFGRVVANHLPDYLPNDVAVVIVNKPGGTGTVGATEVYNSNNDGYKIGLFVNSALTIQPHITETAYPYDGFEPISRLVISPQVLYVQEDSEFDSLDDFVSSAKENPGSLSVGDSGAGGTAHLSVEAFAKEAELDVKSVHFDGNAPALTSLTGGHIEAVVGPPGAATSGLKAIAVIGGNRTSAFEDVPTTTESGYESSVETYVAAFAPPETPKEIIEILNEAFENVLEHKEVIEQSKNLGFDIAHLDPDGLKEHIKQEYEVTKETMEKAGLIE